MARRHVRSVLIAVALFALLHFFYSNSDGFKLSQTSWVSSSPKVTGTEGGTSGQVGIATVGAQPASPLPSAGSSDEGSHGQSSSDVSDDSKGSAFAGDHSGQKTPPSPHKGSPADGATKSEPSAGASPHKEHEAIEELDPSTDPISSDGKVHLTDAELTEKRNSFLSRYVKSLIDLAPTVPPIKACEGDMTQFVIELGNNHIPVTPEVIDERFHMTKEEINDLKKTHARVIAEMPELPKGMYKKGRGIVLTGGGKYFPPLLTAVRWLLDHGEKNPIEIFMASEEYEPDYCDEFLPSQGVHCRIIEDIYGKETVEQFEYMGYPLKLLAMLASTYEDTYFMDVDSLPVKPLDEVFESTVYKEMGYILWPDYWARIVTPAFYEVAGIELKKPSTMPTDKPFEIYDMIGAIPGGVSTESGQIFVNKTTHYKTMLLALYYNLYGFEYYFHLFTMDPGVPGFGDRETFAPAAHVLKEPFYQVEETMHTLGFWVNDGGKPNYEGYGIMQRDPVADYAYHVLNKDPKKVKPDKFPFMALHANSIKLHPAKLYGDENLEKMRWMKLEKKRYFGKLSDVTEAFGSQAQAVGDLEKDLFQSTRNAVCDWMSKQGKIPRDMVGADVLTLCIRASEHVQFLIDNPDASG